MKKIKAVSTTEEKSINNQDMSQAKVSAVSAKQFQSPTPEELLQGKAKKKERLGPWLATSICGNDITSSCLYVSGIAIVYAQAMAPLALLLAAGVLYLYRKDLHRGSGGPAPGRRRLQLLTQLHA